MCGPLEDFLCGVGDSREEALDDFVEGLKALVDFHKHKNQFPEFMRRYFGEEATKVVMPFDAGAASQAEPELYCRTWLPDSSELDYQVA